MPRFSEQFIQQVAQATDIVDLVGKYVALKRAGKEFVALCPFHEDHNPSMHVVPAKQMFYCFVCQAGGGVIKFLEMYEKLSFVEAVRALAERANIPLPVEDSWQPEHQGPNKSDLLKVTAFAAEFFRQQLATPLGKSAMDYATGRGLTAESIERFGIGWAPAGWDGLINAARKRRIPDSLLVATGLAVKREGGTGCYDRFRNRLMFPIFDPDGKAIAFGGRALDKDEKAKYVNSPESILFDKSANLYALNWSRQGIVASGSAIVVEGYMDAIVPLQAGVGNIVATLGTALNERHVRVLSRYARQAVLIFDADAAGMAAAERAMEIFLAQQLHVCVTAVPSGKDPCDYVLAEGGEAFAKLAAEAPDALQYIWERRLAAYRAAGGNLADRRRLVEDFLRLVATSSVYGAIDEVRRGQLAQHIGHMLNISPVDLQRQMQAHARKAARPGAPVASVRSGQEAASGPTEASPVEARILEVLLNRPDLFDQVVERIAPDDFGDAVMRTIAQELWRIGIDGRGGPEDLLASESMSPYGAVIARLVADGGKRSNFEATLREAAEHLAYLRHRREVEELKSPGVGALSDEDLLRLGQAHKSPDLRKHPKIY